MSGQRELRSTWTEACGRQAEDMWLTKAAQPSLSEGPLLPRATLSSPLPAAWSSNLHAGRNLLTPSSNTEKKPGVEKQLYLTRHLLNPERDDAFPTSQLLTETTAKAAQGRATTPEAAPLGKAPSLQGVRRPYTQLSDFFQTYSCSHMQSPDLYKQSEEQSEALTVLCIRVKFYPVHNSQRYKGFPIQSPATFTPTICLDTAHSPFLTICLCYQLR